MKRIFVIVMPLFLALLFFNIDFSAVSAAGTALSDTQKEKIIEHIKNHDPADMSEVRSSDDLTGVVGNTVNWMVYWSDYDSQFYLLYFPPISYACTYPNSVNGVKLQFSPFVEPYSCYYFLYKFSSGDLSCFSTGGHCHPEYGENLLYCLPYRLASFDDIVACSIPLYDNDGLEMFDTSKNPEGLEPPDNGGDSGGGSSGGSGSGGDTGDDSSGILGFLKKIGEALSSILDFFAGVFDFLATFFDAIRLMLCDLFIPRGGFGSFVTEAFSDYLDTFASHFNMFSYSNLVDWLKSSEGYDPRPYFQGRTKFNGATERQLFTFIDLSIWTDRKPAGWGDRNGLEAVQQILRIFFYPLLVLGDWKFLIWLIRGSSSLGSGKD